MGLFDKIGFNPGMNRQVMPTPTQVAPQLGQLQSQFQNQLNQLGPAQGQQLGVRPGGGQQMPNPGMSQLGGGMQPGMGSRGLFDSYMQQLFRQKYAPQPMQGGVQNMGGFMGFAGPQMRPMQAPQAPQQAMQPRTPPGVNNYWDFQGGAPGY